MVQRLAQHTDVRVALVVGGLSLQSQATALRARPEIVVATPVWCLGYSGSSLNPDADLAYDGGNALYRLLRSAGTRGLAPSNAVRYLHVSLVTG